MALNITKTLSAFALATIGIYPMAALSDVALVSRNSSVLDKEKILLHAADSYIFNSDGYLVDGPRNGVGDKIDFSELLTDNEMTLLFMSSLLSCPKGTRYCNNRIGKLPGREVFISINVLDRNEETPTRSNLISRERKILSDLGIRLLEKPIPTAGHIDIIIGDPLSLSRYAQLKSDVLAKAYFDIIASDSALARYTRATFGECFVSDRDRGTGRVVIFMSDHDINICLTQSLLVSFGLNETAGPIPTATSSSRDYLWPTDLDRTFIDALYADDFPDGGSVSQMATFFTSYIKSTEQK